MKIFLFLFLLTVLGLPVTEDGDAIPNEGPPPAGKEKEGESRSGENLVTFSRLPPRPGDRIEIHEERSGSDAHVIHGSGESTVKINEYTGSWSVDVEFLEAEEGLRAEVAFGEADCEGSYYVLKQIEMLAGNRYLVSWKGPKTVVRVEGDEALEKLSAEEIRAVRARIKDFRILDPLLSFLEGQTFEEGEKVELPREVMDALFCSHVTECSLSIGKRKTVDGRIAVPVILRRIIEHGSSGSGNLRLDNGRQELLLEPGTLRILSCKFISAKERPLPDGTGPLHTEERILQVRKHLSEAEDREAEDTEEEGD